MQDKTERWKKLCEEAAVEQDPQRLLELTRETNDLLLGKQRRLERPDNKDKQEWPQRTAQSLSYRSGFLGLREDLDSSWV
jgi:hypothetical protein